VWVDVTVSWHDSEFASSIAGRSGLYVWKGKAAARKWQKVETPSLTTSATVPRPDFHEQTQISLNFSSGTDLSTIITDSVLVDLVKQNRPYGSLDEFRSKLAAACVRRGVAQYEAKIIAILSNPKVILQDVPE
jgi:hypothetical protein